MRDAYAPSHSHTLSHSIGAKDEVRTRDLHLGKVALYQLSYFRFLSARLANGMQR